MTFLLSLFSQYLQTSVTRFEYDIENKHRCFICPSNSVIVSNVNCNCIRMPTPAIQSCPEYVINQTAKKLLNICFLFFPCKKKRRPYVLLFLPRFRLSHLCLINCRYRDHRFSKDIKTKILRGPAPGSLVHEGSHKVILRVYDRDIAVHVCHFTQTVIGKSFFLSIM